MRILYVTPIFTGTEDVILRKNNKFSGLPPFVKTIQRLRKDGHQIDFILLNKSSKSKENLNYENVYYIDWTGQNFIKIISLIKKISKLLKNYKYDFVYGHGSIGVISSLIANFYKIPNGQRLYGAYPILKEIEKKQSKVSIFLKKPLYYLSFITKKDFLIVTNDGTKGDYVYKKLNKKQNLKFYFWTNGVDELHYKNKMDNIEEKFILYPGRIDEQKQQTKVFEVIEKLKEKDINIKVYFAGELHDSPYTKKVLSIVNEKGLEDSVVFLGRVDREQMAYLYKNSLATILLYNISSRGNTALEALKCGSLIITYNNNGLNEFITNGQNGFLVNSESEIASLIEEILNNNIDIHLMKEKAKEVANLKLESWDERIEKEIKLIELIVKEKDNHSEF